MPQAALPKRRHKLPKESSQAQLLEAKDSLQRMLVEIPLTEDERAAVENDDGAVERLIDRLVDVATPAGPTPRHLSEDQPRELPVITVNNPSIPDRSGSDAQR